MLSQSTPICLVDECGRPARVRGWCHAHYMQWRRTGTAERPAPRSLVVRFVDLCEVTDYCWPWRGTINANGYGRFKADGKLRLAHRVSYELFVGCIPDGYEVDHLCRITECVNPDHLEAVTVLENNARKSKMFCVNGHPQDERNVRIVSTTGKRQCRICIRENMRRWRANHAGG